MKSYLLLTPTLVACMPHHSETASRCMPDSDELLTIHTFEKNLHSSVKIASKTIDASDWFEPGEVKGIEIELDAWDGWKRRSRCPLRLSDFLPEGRIFEPGRDRVESSDGWVFLGRVAVSSNSRSTALPIWGMRTHALSDDYLPPIALIFIYKFNGNELIFHDSINLNWPDNPVFPEWWPGRGLPRPRRGPPRPAALVAEPRAGRVGVRRGVRAVAG